MIDVSPPSVGEVSAEASNDVTSHDAIHVRWHGFHDEESGVKMYRVALADRCLTTEEVQETDNFTEISDGYSVILTALSNGMY